MSKTAAPPEPGQGKRGEAGYLGYLLRQAAAAHRHRMDKALEDLAITTPQFALLTMLRAYPGQSSADLARLALLTPQTVSVIVVNLERAGLIGRRRHEAHGRIQHIELTEPGAALLNEATARVRGVERTLTAGLSQAEEGAVRRWLASAATEKPAR
ncbi:MAG TPA: MarR family transcriptional regulator [Roseiarcus sp.]|nr:MarR family transcriptional regulator [Roseiarcus sp.]